MATPAPSERSAFASLRFDDIVPVEAGKVQDALAEHDVSLQIVNMKGECERMPAYAVLERASLTFTNLAVNGKPVPEWRPRARCAGNPLCDCGNAASIRENDGAVTLSWRVRT